MSYVLAIDQGTTSSRAIVFRGDISIAASAQQEFPQHFPASGWVEHEPEDIWTSTMATCREALKKAGVGPKDIAAIGITNQRERADRGELMFGTVDCYLLWRLTGGRVHATDATNASRTLLFNIHTGLWDDELLKILRVPRSMLPEVKDSSANFGDSTPELFGGSIAISGIAGDQQAATIGQACFAPGMIKSTYGTGCFALLNTG